MQLLKELAIVTGGVLGMYLLLLGLLYLDYKIAGLINPYSNKQKKRK